MKTPASIALAWLLLTLLPSAAQALDTDLYARILLRHTREVSDLAGTRVDYQSIGKDPEWKTLVAGLATDRPETLEGDAALAFWINTYNVLAIDVVVRNYPVDSIRDVGSLFRSVWRRDAGKVGSRVRTLDEIEHQILRPRGEPRIHAAIVCASTSCPSLARTPFTAAGLDTELDAAVVRWLADQGKGVRIDRSSERVTLSRIFKWFADDFETSGGAIAFAAKHLPEEDAAWLRERAARLGVDYFDYDWALNDLRGGTEKGS